MSHKQPVQVGKNGTRNGQPSAVKPASEVVPRAKRRTFSAEYKLRILADADACTGWGETRVNTGTTFTTWRFTGQREDATIGLYFYNARYYDPLLGRFTQPDTIVPNPGDPQALNRYSYTLNNPVRYTDPTGMFSEDEIMEYLGVTTWDEVLAMFGEGGAMAGVWGYLEALREAQLGTPIKMWFDVSHGFNEKFNPT